MLMLPMDSGSECASRTSGMTVLRHPGLDPGSILNYENPEGLRPPGCYAGRSKYTCWERLYLSLFIFRVDVVYGGLHEPLSHRVQPHSAFRALTNAQHARACGSDFHLQLFVSLC